MGTVGLKSRVFADDDFRTSYMKFQIPNHKSQINSKLQFQMTQAVLFGILSIVIYL